MFIIYTKQDCPWCDKAKALLDNMLYEYVERHYGTDFTKEDLITLTGKEKPTVPYIISDTGARIGGYEDLRKYLNVK